MAGDPDGNPEQQATFWVGAVTGLVQPEGESLQSWLKSGVVLCELVEKISPGCAGKTSSEEVLASKPQLVRRMKEMENIVAYSEAARSLGVPEADMFVTFDLYEDKNMAAVVRNLHSLGRVAQQKGLGGPMIGGKLGADPTPDPTPNPNPNPNLNPIPSPTPNPAI